MITIRFLPHLNVDFRVEGGMGSDKINLEGYFFQLQMALTYVCPLFYLLLSLPLPPTN